MVHVLIVNAGLTVVLKISFEMLNSHFYTSNTALTLPPAGTLIQTPGACGGVRHMVYPLTGMNLIRVEGVFS